MTKTYTQSDLNAALVAMMEKCAEHHKEIGEFTVGCSCGWFTDSRDSMSDDELWRNHVKSIVLPADIVASVERERSEREQEIRDEVNHLHAQSHDAVEASFERERRKLQLEARIAEAKLWNGDDVKWLDAGSREAEEHIAALEAELKVAVSIETPNE